MMESILNKDQIKLKQINNLDFNSNNQFIKGMQNIQ